MTQEERDKIISNDYFDLFIDYSRNPNVLRQFENQTIQIITQRFAITYLPTNQINNRTIVTLGYSAIPACYGLLSERSLEASGVDNIRQTPSFNLRGQGVLVGVIDTGIDYTNPVFINPDGSSRILSIWDQTIQSAEPMPEGPYYGSVYTREQLNQALQSENPLEIVPSIDVNGHGTMLAGIAAGNVDTSNRFSGVAPNSELVVVKLKQAKPVIQNFWQIPPDVPCYQENDIILGIQYLLTVARQYQRPISICIGLGTSLGAHDGRSNLSSYVNEISDYPGVIVTIAAGNEGNTRKHYFGRIDPALGFDIVELHVGENQSGFTMELWGYAPSSYSVDITSPSGEYIPRITEGLNINREISFIFESTIIRLDYRMVEAQTGDQLILFRFINPAHGVWRFQVYGRGDLVGSFNIWLPISGFVSEDTYFIQSNPYTTITLPGNAPLPITITAYNPVNGTLYQRASKGYTRNNIVKPDLAAPGVNILYPTLEKGFAEGSGTSLAAAHATGIVAMFLEWSIVKGNYPGVDTGEVKSFLIRGARRSNILRYPNQDWGYGIIDIFNVFNILREE